MRILVTGGTGFVGSHLVPTLLARGHELTLLSRSREKLLTQPWHDQVRFVAHDINVGNPAPALDALGNPELLVHLAWPGLPNYKDLFHIEQNLPADYLLIKTLVAAGLPRVMVTGTCFEYGMQEGCLAEDGPTRPETPYGLAKDTLRKGLEMLARQLPFQLTWVRLFYMHGSGQHARSLMAQLDQAIARGDSHFNMSGGEQLRDFLAVHQVATILADLADHPARASGIYNCCSGQPVSVRNLVEARLREKGAAMQLNLGYYPYPDYEPMAFWGSRLKLDAVLGSALQHTD
jgi:dTDP-6-deoxy-L-talose 4-dehydrogenase (NAD+)